MWNITYYNRPVFDEIVMLHSFVKKTQQTPKKELELARKRLKEVTR
jgi:phage-related protein